jgi:hypothetical protein
MSSAKTRARRVIGLGVASAALCVCLCGSVYAKPKNKASAPPPPPAAEPKDNADQADKPEANHAEPSTTPAPAQPTAAGPKAAVTISPAPKAAEPSAEPSAEPAPDANGEKLASLRAEVTTLMDDLVEARSRAALLGKTLFKTQVRVLVQNLAAPDPVLSKLVLKLDGAPIFRGEGNAVSDEPRQVFQGFIAPGAHVLSVEVEQQSRDDAAYGYGLHNSYRFSALREKRSDLLLVLDDDSDLASEFPDDGEYDVRTRLKVKTKDLTEE